ADAVYHRPQMPYTQQLLGAIPKGWGVGGTTVFTAP
ncbi:MAG: hypothetical protein RIR79_1666, partial [Pseudomonadota bacterium]